MDTKENKEDVANNIFSFEYYLAHDKRFKNRLNINLVEEYTKWLLKQAKNKK